MKYINSLYLILLLLLHHSTNIRADVSGITSFTNVETRRDDIIMSNEFISVREYKERVKFCQVIQSQLFLVPTVPVGTIKQDGIYFQQCFIALYGDSLLKQARELHQKLLVTVYINPQTMSITHFNIVQKRNLNDENVFFNDLQLVICTLGVFLDTTPTLSDFTENGCIVLYLSLPYDE